MPNPSAIDAPTPNANEKKSTAMKRSSNAIRTQCRSQRKSARLPLNRIRTTPSHMEWLASRRAKLSGARSNPSRQWLAAKWIGRSLTKKNALNCQNSITWTMFTQMPARAKSNSRFSTLSSMLKTTNSSKDTNANWKRSIHSSVASSRELRNRLQQPNGSIFCGRWKKRVRISLLSERKGWSWSEKLPNSHRVLAIDWR